jgi:hypothetical protein
VLVEPVRTVFGSLAAAVATGEPDRVGTEGVGTAYTVEPTPSESTSSVDFCTAIPSPRRCSGNAIRTGEPRSAAAMSPPDTGQR